MKGGEPYGELYEAAHRFDGRGMHGGEEPRKNGELCRQSQHRKCIRV